MFPFLLQNIPKHVCRVRHRRLDTFAPSTQRSPFPGISSLILPITRPRPPDIKVDSFADVIPLGRRLQTRHHLYGDWLGEAGSRFEGTTKKTGRPGTGTQEKRTKEKSEEGGCKHGTFCIGFSWGGFFHLRYRFLQAEKFSVEIPKHNRLSV